MRRWEAIVLAAGMGSRFGGGKLLARWRDGVLLEGALAAAFAAPVLRVHVVWGADPAVAAAAKAFAERTRNTERLSLVYAARHAEGMSASLAAGVTALSEDSEGMFAFLGDMPRIPPGIAQAMVQAFAGDAAAVASAFGGRRGHPVLFSRTLWPDLLALTGDRGAGDLLRGLGSRLVLVPAPDDGVLYDVDRRDDMTP